MAAILGAGTILQISIIGVYTSIANVTSVNGLDMTCDDVDITHLLSTGRWREFLAGFRDGGNCEFEANYTSAGYGMLFVTFGVSGNLWRLIFSDASRIDWSGHLNKLSPQTPLDEEISMSGSIKASGVPVFTV
jgi:predicted secreted protein